MKRKNLIQPVPWLLAGVACLGLCLPSLGAEDVSETIQELRRQIQELDQKLRTLESQQKQEKEVAAAKAKSTPMVSLGANGFSVQSADSNFVFKIRGYIQADARFYGGEVVDSGVHDTFLVRRARPIFEGSVYDRFDYRVMLDFGSQASLSSANNALLQDAYVTARLWPELQLQAGKFKEPVGLERLQSGANLLFLERAFPTQLVPNRDVGFQLQGDVFKQTLRYEVGVFNGVANGGSGDADTSDSDKDVAGRIFTHPFRHAEWDWLRGLGLGVGGSYGRQEGSLRSFTSDGTQRFFTYRTSNNQGAPNVVADGTLWRLSPQAYYYVGPFGLMGEYAFSSQEVRQAGGGAGAGQSQRLGHQGWQVAGSYFLTGEANSFRPVAPKRPFLLGSPGWGALELVARVSQLDVDNDAFPIFSDPSKSATEALSFAVGLNWHLNRNVKLSFDYSHTEFEAPRGNPYASEPENVFLTRVQLAF